MPRDENTVLRANRKMPLRKCCSNKRASRRFCAAREEARNLNRKAGLSKSSSSSKFGLIEDENENKSRSRRTKSSFRPDMVRVAFASHEAFGCRCHRLHLPRPVVGPPRRPRLRAGVRWIELTGADKWIMKSLTEQLWFEVPNRRGFVNITDTVEQLVRKSGVKEGLCLVNAMHITKKDTSRS
jgi:hypothetical protein